MFSDDHFDAIKRSKGQFRINDINDTFLNDFFDKRIKDSHKSETIVQTVIENGNRIFFANHINETGWFLISIVPRNELIKAVNASYRYFWTFGIIIMLFLVLISAVIIYRLVIPALNNLVSGIKEISEGNLEYSFSLRKK